MLCLYTMVTEHDKDGMNTHMIPSLYDRIAKHVKAGQYVEYIHVGYLSNGVSALVLQQSAPRVIFILTNPIKYFYSFVSLTDCESPFSA